MQSDDVSRLAEMITRRSEMLLRLLEDLTLVHQLEHGVLDVDLQPVDLAAAAAADKNNIHFCKTSKNLYIIHTILL